MGTRLALRDIDERILQPLLQSVVADSETGILVTDLNHKTLICNERFGAIWGVDIDTSVRESVEGVRAAVRSRLTDIPTWEENLIQVYRDPYFRQTDQLILQDPHAVLHRYTGPLVDSGGAAVGRLWTFQDRTRSDRKTRILEALHETSLMIDADPRKVYAGIVERTSQYFGTWVLLSILDGQMMRFEAVGGATNPAQGVEGNPVQDSYCQLCMKQDQTLLIQDARLDEVARNILPCSLGLTRYLGVPVRRPSGEAIGTLCILDGLSEQEFDPEEIRFLEQIAARIGGEIERENHLAQLQSELSTVQKNLIDQEKLVVTGQLSASISHDIRNILSTMQLQMKMPGLSDSAKLELMDEQITRFRVLSNRLLSYCKPHSGHMEQVDMHEILLSVLEMLNAHAELAQISVEINLDASDAWILGDRVRLEHLFLNLLLNAVQIVDQGGRIGIQTLDVGEDLIQVMVWDSGRGMSLDAQQNLFVPFQSGRPDGIGLGLYSAKQIIEMHNAVIRCESEIGAGTKFLMEFERC